MPRAKKHPHETSHDVFLTGLRKKLIPWSLGTASPLVWMKPPFGSYPGVSVKPIRAPLLKVSSRQKNGSLTTWAREQLSTSQYPCICCVAEGEIDCVIGITEAMGRTTPELDPKIGRYALRAPQKTFLILPPEIPRDNGSAPHWAEENSPVPDSQLLWIHPQPHGVVLHICQTRRGEHVQLRGIFLKDPHILTLMELLMDDMQTHSANAPNTPRQYMNAILQRLEQALSQRATFETEEAMIRATAISSHQPASPDATAVERACRYIHNHYTARLSVEAIAAHSYVSVSHLIRLFRSELNTSPMAYVQQLRMESARSLLSETRISVSDLSNYLGYKHPDIFTRAFLRAHGCAPTIYRKQNPIPAPNTKRMKGRIPKTINEKQ